jgi:hypothetical protein
MAISPQPAILELFKKELHDRPEFERLEKLVPQIQMR